MSAAADDGPRVVRGAAATTPLLAALNAAGELAAADLHVARALGRLTGERDERVLLACAFAVRGARQGSVCVRLDDLRLEEPGSTALLPGPTTAWADALRVSPMVADGPGAADPVRPLRWVDERLYLDRYWRDEQVVRAAVAARLASPVEETFADDAVVRAVDRLFPTEGEGRQRLVAACAVVSRLTVLTGGPGTGKTTTVARLLAVLREVLGPGLRVALAAPTGKAAARLEEAVNDETEGTGDRFRATTIHRMLRPRPGSSTRFRHDRDHHLPFDVVVVDESSMIPLTLMARLLEALRPQARLVLVGDPDQLASVEAGVVLGDLVARPADAVARGRLGALLPRDVSALDAEAVAGLSRGVVRLVREHRFNRHIAALAAAIRAGHEDDVLALLRGKSPADANAAFANTSAADTSAADTSAANTSAVNTSAVNTSAANTSAVNTSAADISATITFVETADGAPPSGTATGIPSAAPVIPVATQPAGVRADVERWGLELTRAAEAGDVPGALAALGTHRLLLAHREGSAGESVWSARAAGWIDDARERARRGDGRPGHDAPDAVGVPGAVGGPGDAPDAAPWPVGTPLLVRENDPATGLSNGDTGVVLGTGEVAFGDPRAPRLVRPYRLPPVRPVHAMTVHRAQGSQFRGVTVVLPAATSPLLTRELLYTAVTRARETVRIIGSEEAVRVAVRRPIRRASGLAAPDPADRTDPADPTDRTDRTERTDPTDPTLR